MHVKAATKILARQLIRLRQQIANLQGSRAQVRGVATHTQVQTLKTGTCYSDFNIYDGHFFILFESDCLTELGL